MKISEQIKQYRKEKTAIGYSPNTIDRVVGNINLMTRELGATRTRDLHTSAIIDWGIDKLQEGKRPTTIGAYYNSMRAFTKHLAQKGIEIDVDPERLRSYGKHKSPRIFLKNDVKLILRHSDAQTKILITLLFTSGLRISEAIAIDYEAIIAEDRLYVKKKGGESSTVIVPSSVGKELLRLSLASSNGFCFVDSNGDQLKRNQAYYAIKKAFAASGYGWATPHTLRHSFCTELLRNGADLSHVSRLMRHSNVAITQRYTHLVLDDVARTHKLLGW